MAEAARPPRSRRCRELFCKAVHQSGSRGNRFARGASRDRRRLKPNRRARWVKAGILALPAALRHKNHAPAQVSRRAMRAAACARRAASPMEAQAELIPLLETLYASRNPTRRWLHCTRRDWIIAKLGECARAGARRALEVGFGVGVYLPALAANFTETVATDLDDAHLAHARPIAARYPNLRLVRDNLLDSQLPAASFDLILCSEVIEHIPDT